MILQVEREKETQSLFALFQMDTDERTNYERARMHAKLQERNQTFRRINHCNFTSLNGFLEAILKLVSRKNSFLSPKYRSSAGL